MPTQQTYQQAILSAQLIMANLLTVNLNKVKIGDGDVSYSRIRNFDYNINALTYQLNRPDYTSATTLTIYDRLCSLIGVDTTANTIDPNYQAPNTTLIVTGTGGTTVNSNKIPFSNTTNVALLNYKTTYKHLYGNNPTINVYLDGYVEDVATPPTITYEVSGDISSDIVSITWDYPVAVSGYIQIIGSPPSA
jgi:hypothetical protein